jgi:hypothetical protein
MDVAAHDNAMVHLSLEPRVEQLPNHLIFVVSDLDIEILLMGSFHLKDKSPMVVFVFYIIVWDVACLEGSFKLILYALLFIVLHLELFI